MKRFLIVTMLVLFAAASSMTTARSDIFGDLKKISKKVSKTIKKEADKADKTLKKVGKAIGKETKKFGNTLKNTVSKANINRAKQKLGRLPAMTASAFKSISPSDLMKLRNAIKKKNGQEAVRLMTNMIKRSSALRTLVLEAKKFRLRSLTIQVGGDASYVVTGAASIGIAYDVEALGQVIRTGSLPRGKRVATLFWSGGVAVGASAGASVDLIYGFSVDRPQDMGGVSMDVNVEMAVAAGGNAAFSFKPGIPPPFESFSLGISGGANVRVSGGLSGSGIITEIRN